MKAIIEASEFKRLVANTKKFISRYESNKLMGYIYLEVNADTKEIKATALDGHRVSVEYAMCAVAEESFSCYIKPAIPKITKHNHYVELELTDNKAYITVGDNIMGYKQPEGEYYKTDKMVSELEEKPPAAVIYADANLLKSALESVSGLSDYKPVVKIEIRDKKDPIVIKKIRFSETTKDIKLVLPVNVTEKEG